MQSTAKAAKGMFELSIRFNDGYAAQFLSEDDLTGLKTQVSAAHKTLNDRSGLGNDFLGWADLPVDYDKEEFARIKKAAEKIISDTDVFIVIGIGGSYLGARAAIEFLKSPLYNNLPKKTPDIYFSGNSISGSAVQDLLKICEGKRVSVNVISKSGTTTEPAIAFRIFREYLENRYGHEEAVKRIYCTTDKARGTLKQLADEQGYESFVVPDDVGGRFSVLTAVGLLPIAVAGADIDALMKGAAAAREDYMADDIENNDCYKYAALRNAFYRRGKEIELLDTPGILWPKFEDQQVGLNLALTGSINDEILNIEELAGEFIRFMQNRYPGVIEERYGIENCSDVIDAIENIAKVRGCLLKGGAYDTKKASRQIIDDFRNGKLGRISLETPVK